MGWDMKSPDGFPVHWLRPVVLPEMDRPVSIQPAPIERLVATKENHWLPLHRYAPDNAHDWQPMAAMRFYNTWQANIPQYLPAGETCGCKSHWIELTSRPENAPVFSTAKEFFEWGVARHDDVSRLHSGAKRFSLEEAYQIHWNIFRPVDRDIPSPTNGRLIISVGAGANCEAMLEIAKPNIQAYADRVGADYVQLTGKTQAWWGLEKFRVHQFAKMYDQTLFVDSDVLIRHDAPDIFEVGGIAMHDDLPHLQSEEWILPEYEAVLKSQGLPGQWGRRWLLNSGVVLCDRESADVWLPPLRPLPTDHCAEQFWVEIQAEKLEMSGSRVSKLDRRFNHQWWMRDFQDKKSDAWFFHYANAKDKIGCMSSDVKSLSP
jgi:hypothetical protein